VIPEGEDSHTYEPKPSVAELFAKADVVFVNGLSLEDPTKGLAEKNLTGGGASHRAGFDPADPGRVHLRLLVPPRRREAQPAPVDQPAHGPLLRRGGRKRARKGRPANAAYYKANATKFEARSTTSTSGSRLPPTRWSRTTGSC